MKHSHVRLVLLLLLTAPAASAWAQQTAVVAPGSVPEFGTMWTFDAPPLDYWKTRYGFEASQSWLDHLRLSAIRLPGCSSSFVSKDGLVMTNHHCARACIDAVSTHEHDYLQDGFVAARQEDEVRCPGLYVDQLVAIRDVTATVRAAVTARADAEQVAQRDAAIEGLTRSCEATGERCQVVAFYNGGMYSLYRYHRYDDLRLVMAPELQTAFYGGDDDNFTYPRYDLDVSFLRVYQDGRPFHPKDYLSWSQAGAADGEPVFVVGNPGSTGRLLTLAQMEYLRDVDYPARLADYQRRLDVLYALSAKSPEVARRNENTIFGIENSKKAVRGYLDGLLDATIMARKEAFERDFRTRIAADPALAERFGDPWDAIADAQLELSTFATQSRFYALNGSALLGWALDLVRVTRQSALPEAQRLPAYQGQGLERARRALLRDQPVDTEVERLQLASWLTAARDALGPDDALVRALLKGRTPEAAADALVASSELEDAGARASLVDGGVAAVDGCADPIVQAVRDLEPVANGYVRRTAQLNAQISANAEKLGQAIFAAYGTALPPDATFTLRISDGVVKGFPMNGTVAPYRTTFYGLFARASEFGDAGPFHVPARWRAKEHALDLDTPLDFVSTADIIGGNSGSPVVNRAGEVVGLVFDGNIEMLPNRFIFTDEVSRCVSVHSMALTEALRNVYDAARIADELQGTGR